MKKIAAAFVAVLIVASAVSAAKYQFVKGATSTFATVFIQDSSVTTGAGLTGLVWNTASLQCQYYIEDAASSVSITLATMTLGTWATGGFVVVDATNMAGTYSLAIPDAALTGGDHVVVMCDGATNMAPLLLEIQLTGVDLNDAVRAGMTALPNVAAGAAGGLPDDTDANGAVRLVDGTGAREIDTSSGAVVSVTTATTCTTNTDMLTAAAVNGEMVDVLKVDTSALPGQAAPTVTPTIEEMLEFLYKAWRNKKEQTATEFRIYDDAGAVVDQKATVSDDGSVTTVEEIATGP